MKPSGLKIFFSLESFAFTTANNTDGHFDSSDLLNSCNNFLLLKWFKLLQYFLAFYSSNNENII